MKSFRLLSLPLLAAALTAAVSAQTAPAAPAERRPAPPAAAQTLAALFSGLAQLLGQVEEAGS